MPRDIHPRNAKRNAEQGNGNIAKPETAVKTRKATKQQLFDTERRARRAQLKAEHRKPNVANHSATAKTSKRQPRKANTAADSVAVMPKKEQPQYTDRDAKQRDNNGAGSSMEVVPDNEHPRSPEEQAEQANDNVPHQFKSTVMMFDELGPPDEDGPKTWTWRLRMLAWKRLALTKEQYSKINWEKEFDFQKFQAECTEYNPCFIEWYRNRRVPIACSKHNQGTNQMWRLRDKEVQDQWSARFAAEKEEEETAWKAFEERFDRALAENPNLVLSDKLWKPVAPGVAIITGTSLVDVAAFFCDCDITVEEDIVSNPTVSRRYTEEGRDIIAQVQSRSEEIKWSTHSWSQLRISIDKFRRPSLVRDRDHPGRAVVRNPKGPYGNALCALILFLGRTGQPAPEKIDDKCCYWFYYESGFSGADFSKIGQKGPFRMVRLLNVSHRDHVDLMRAFDLRIGQEEVKAFSKGFLFKVKHLKVRSSRWQDFRLWHDLPREPVDPEIIEDDDPIEDDNSKDVENENVQDSDFEISEDGGDDESDIGVQWPITGTKSNIPRHFRGGAKA